MENYCLFVIGMCVVQANVIETTSYDANNSMMAEITVSVNVARLEITVAYDTNAQ